MSNTGSITLGDRLSAEWESFSAGPSGPIELAQSAFDSYPILTVAVAAIISLFLLVFFLTVILQRRALRRAIKTRDIHACNVVDVERRFRAKNAGRAKSDNTHPRLQIGKMTPCKRRYCRS